MKKFLLLLLIFISYSAISEEITKTFYFSNPEIKNINGYITINFPETMQNATLGNPLLPYYATEILLPAGHEASDVQLIFGKQTDITAKGCLYPKQATRPISQPGEPHFYKNDEIYNSKMTYPSTSHGVLSTYFYRGHSIANVAFTPVQYLPSENSISYYESVTVVITTVPTEKAQQALKLLKETDDLSQIVDNQEEIDNFYSSLVKERDANDYEILIISTSNHASAFDELRSMYLKYGLASEFKAVSEIYTEMDGDDNQEKIRNYIIQEYTDHSVEYVVLGGDIEKVPYRGFYCTVQSSSVYEDDDIPADLYYSALDGTWNDDNDNNWGEIGEDDLYPEVSVARMPFSNDNELNAMLHKTISYQQNPVLGELNSPLLVGEWLYSDPISWGADYVEMLVGDRDDNGYSTNGIPETDPYDSLYDRNATWNANQLKARMNQGMSFLYHNGHANSDYVMRFYNSDITNNNFSNLNGVTHNYTLIYTHGCICGAFDNNDCIGEKMVTIDNLAVGGCFNSRYGWFNEGQTEGPSLHINREFVDALYTDKYNRYGRAHKESKTATVPWVNAPGQWEEGALRWCFYDCNAFGDPTLAIWRDDPYALSAGFNSSILPGTTSFEVTVYCNQLGGFVENAACVLMNGNELIGKGFTNEEGVCNIAINGTLPTTGTITLYVSAYNTALNTFNIAVGDPNAPNISLIDISYIDENGNDVVEYDENVTAEVTFSNIGGGDLTNGTITLSSGSEYITVTNGNATCSNLLAGETFTATFNFHVAENIPNQEVINIAINFAAQSFTWNFANDIIIAAPTLTPFTIFVTDDNNNQINPDETVNLLCSSTNSGDADANNIALSLNCSSTNVNIINPTINVSTLAVGENLSENFNVEISPDIEVGTTIIFTLTVSYRGLEDTYTYSAEIQTVGCKEYSKVFKIYPNPNDGIFTVLTKSASTINIFSANGRLVYTTECQEAASINLSDYPSGIYYINVFNDTNKETQKVILK